MLSRAWTKAASCESGNCVEVRKVEAMMGETWRKATKSNNNGACAEVRRTADEIQVRDSKNPTGPVLSFTPAEWEAFLDGANKGEFNLS